jgi:uncharacterized membrane protein YuzA (DUF378 family)
MFFFVAVMVLLLRTPRNSELEMDEWSSTAPIGNVRMYVDVLPPQLLGHWQLVEDKGQAKHELLKWHPKSGAKTERGDCDHPLGNHKKHENLCDNFTVPWGRLSAPPPKGAAKSGSVTMRLSSLVLRTREGDIDGNKHVEFIDAMARLRLGAFVTDSFGVLKLHGGRVDASRWVVFGYTPPLLRSRHIASEFVSDSSEKLALAEKLTVPPGLNSTQAWTFFRLLAANSSARSSGGEIVAQECFWIGTLWVAKSEPDKPNATVSGSLWSTCGHELSVVLNEQSYIDLTRATNALLLLTCLPISAVLYGLWDQHQWIRHSRARMLRVSRIQVLLIGAWVAVVISNLDVMWTIFPLAKRTINVLYAISLVAEIWIVQMFFSITAEVHRNMSGHHRRAVVIFVFLGFICVNFLLLAEGKLYKPSVVTAAAAVFWLPQIVHILKGSAGNGLTNSFIVCVTCIPCGVFSALLAGPRLGWSLPTPEDGYLFVGIATVCAEACILVLFRSCGSKRVLPRFMTPWRHDYSLSLSTWKSNGGVEDPDCSICTMPLDDGEAVAWITPCRHVFHPQCLRTWMDQRMECPLCRAPLPDP